MPGRGPPSQSPRPLQHVGCAKVLAVWTGVVLNEHRGAREYVVGPPSTKGDAVTSKSRLLTLALAVVMGSGCGEAEPGVSVSKSAESQAVALQPEKEVDRVSVFADQSADSGLEFVQFNGMSGEFFMAEVTGSGGALFDYDDDGDLDVYLLQGTMLGPGKTLADATFPTSYPQPLTDRLYRNDLDIDEHGNTTLRFTDVTEQTGLTASLYGMGVATGDFNNDGRIDLYVTNFGPNQLLRNDGQGPDGLVRFTDVTQQAGVGDPRWSVPAAFFDFDRDGHLDLFVGNYIAADLTKRTICRDFIGAKDYCGPGAFPSEPDRLFRNLGNGTFVDVTTEAGLTSGFGGALGVVTADFNGDGWEDIYVANDSQANNLWLNGGDGTFRDEALLAGCSVNANGKAEASMGVDAGDLDGDGDLDLFMAHLTSETNTLYLNDGHGIFSDATIRSGLGPPSRLFTTFGTGWIDYDNDGWLDLIAVNGAVKKIEDLARRGDPFPVHQSNQLFRNLGSDQVGRFEEVTALGGPAFELSEVSRGAIQGDIDNDGDTDVLVVNNSGPARLLINRVGKRQHWLGLRLLGQDVARDMLGARAVLIRKNQPPLWRRSHTEGSFASANDPRILFGLADEVSIDGIRIHWPDGRSEEWNDVPIDQYTTLRQGGGQPAAGDS